MLFSFLYSLMLPTAFISSNKFLQSCVDAVEVSTFEWKIVTTYDSIVVLYRDYCYRRPMHSLMDATEIGSTWRCNCCIVPGFPITWTARLGFIQGHVGYFVFLVQLSYTVVAIRKSMYSGVLHLLYYDWKLIVFSQDCMFYILFIRSVFYSNIALMCFITVMSFDNWEIYRDISMRVVYKNTNWYELARACEWKLPQLF